MTGDLRDGGDGSSEGDGLEGRDGDLERERASLRLLSGIRDDWRDSLLELRSVRRWWRAVNMLSWLGFVQLTAGPGDVSESSA